jgi:ribulose 1,5-bisphosphate carboxylase large subunit-like protein
MSTGILHMPERADLFHWSDALDPRDYVRATYVVTSLHDGEATAIALAMEQSAATTAIAGYVEPGSLHAHTIRICAVDAAGGDVRSEVAPFEFNADRAGLPTGQPRNWRITLAIPLRLSLHKPTQLLNGVVGDIPRLGFITRFRLDALALPDTLGPGPGFGVAGVRERFGCARGPLLCRAQRPAVGLDLDTMARLHHDTLASGFHLVKDCEMQAFADNAAFAAHVRRMVEARDAARRETGEHKGYVANLICEPDELVERWDIACRLGVDGALVAPGLQGLGTLAALAKQRRMPLLANNSLAYLFSRHPGWGIAHPVLCQVFERMGADVVLTAGEFGLDTLREPWPPPAASAPGRAMPMLMGGKHPGGLDDYRRALGNDDYMINVVTWVDTHPEGLQAAAAHFRRAVDAQQTD